MKVLVEKIEREGVDVKLPEYKTDGAAGMDVFAAVTTMKVIHPGTSGLIPSGIRVAIPEGYEIQVRSRSGLALKHNVFVLNSPGTIDSDYIGEIGVILFNSGQTDFTVRNGEAIAQIVLAPIEKCYWHPVSAGELPETKRGEKGFGSTSA